MPVGLVLSSPQFYMQVDCQKQNRWPTVCLLYRPFVCYEEEHDVTICVTFAERDLKLCAVLFNWKRT